MNAPPFLRFKRGASRVSTDSTAWLEPSLTLWTNLPSLLFELGSGVFTPESKYLLLGNAIGDVRVLGRRRGPSRANSARTHGRYHDHRKSLATGSKDRKVPALARRNGTGNNDAGASPRQLPFAQMTALAAGSWLLPKPYMSLWHVPSLGIGAAEAKKATEIGQP